MTDASWCCSWAIAMVDVSAVLKKLCEVMPAVRCAGGSGMQRAGPVIPHVAQPAQTHLSH